MRLHETKRVMVCRLAAGALSRDDPAPLVNANLLLARGSPGSAGVPPVPGRLLVRAHATGGDAPALQGWRVVRPWTRGRAAAMAFRPDDVIRPPVDAGTGVPPALPAGPSQNFCALRKNGAHP